MVDHIPKDPGDAELFKQQILSDTGVFCRRVLGMDTDRDQKGNISGEEGKGGVRAHGPHAEVIKFIDDWDPLHPFRHLMCPRYAYKSSMAQGLIARALLAYPDISILTMMANKQMAADRVAVVKDILETNPVIQELYPGLKCSGSKYAFTTSIRGNTTLQSPSLWAGSPQNIPTGGRPNFILLDDLADDVNTRTEGGLRKCIESAQACLLLRSRDGILLNIATPRHDGDLSGWIAEQPGWTKCVHLDVGCDLIQDEMGKPVFVGTPRWPHLSLDFLNSQLKGGLSYVDAMSQYKLKVVAGLHAHFKRNQFQPFAFKSEHSGLTGYLLTDVATSLSKESCLNVLMEVGVDQRGNVYILECQIGRWPMLEFIERLVSMRARWSGRINHQAEIMETTAVNQGYRQQMAAKARANGIRLNIVPIVRNASARNKDVRILNTQSRFQSRQVFVNNEMTGTTWANDADVRVIWDPEGYKDIDTGQVLPDGEIVQQFIRHPYHPLKDIPDTFALVDEVDKETGQLVCFYRRPSPQMNPDVTLRRPTVRPSLGSQGYTSKFYKRANRRNPRGQ